MALSLIRVYSSTREGVWFCLTRQRREKGIILTPLRAGYVPKLSTFLLSRAFACSALCSKLWQNKVIILLLYSNQWVGRNAFVSVYSSLC